MHRDFYELSSEVNVHTKKTLTLSKSAKSLLLDYLLLSIIFIHQYQSASVGDFGLYAVELWPSMKNAWSRKAKTQPYSDPTVNSSKKARPDGRLPTGRLGLWPHLSDCSDTPKQYRYSVPFLGSWEKASIEVKQQPTGLSQYNSTSTGIKASRPQTENLRN